MPAIIIYIDALYFRANGHISSSYDVLNDIPQIYKCTYVFQGFQGNQFFISKKLY